MKVFISWSGEKSHRVAVAFRYWLRLIFHSVEFYVSSEDIDKGTRWSSELSKELEASQYGIICVTQDNFQAPWLAYEAGALSKSVGESLVVPFLFDILPSEIRGPLKMFQSATFCRDDIKKMVISLNKANVENNLSEKVLDDTFDALYPNLENRLKPILDYDVQFSQNEDFASSSQSSIIERILQVCLENQAQIKQIKTSLRNIQLHGSKDDTMPSTKKAISLNIRIDDLACNPDPRIPVCLCLDTSASMLTVSGAMPTEDTKVIDNRRYRRTSGGVTRLDMLQKAVENFCDLIYADEFTRYSVEMSIVTFDDHARLISNFNRVEHDGVRENVPKLIANGTTSLGEGINLALDILEKRKQEYKNAGVDFYTPLLILITDGESTGSLNELKKAKSRLASLVSKKLMIYPLAIGEANIDTLASLSPVQKPLRIEEVQLDSLFNWIFKGLYTTSRADMDSVDSAPPLLEEYIVKSWDTPIS